MRHYPLERILYLRTKKARLVREGFAPAQCSYTHILKIQTVVPRSQAGVHTVVLRLPQILAERLLRYQRDFLSSYDPDKIKVDCAHFACFMAGISVPDWQHALKRLDTIKEKTLLPSELPRGRIGIISTTQDLHDRVGFHHILHTGIGLGNGLWLNVTGLDGNLAVSRIADDLAYQQSQVRTWYGKAYSPSFVQLHIGPVVHTT